jgi:hypothetical protein
MSVLARTAVRRKTCGPAASLSVVIFRPLGRVLGWTGTALPVVPFLADTRVLAIAATGYAGSAAAAPEAASSDQGHPRTGES